MNRLIKIRKRYEKFNGAEILLLLFFFILCKLEEYSCYEYIRPFLHT